MDLHHDLVVDSQTHLHYIRTMSYQYNAVYYRKSQYSSPEEAKRVNALFSWHTTYCYSNTMDSFFNSIDMLKCYDPSIVDEFVFIFTIDKVRFPEMTYREVFELLHQSYDNFNDGKNKILEKGTKLTVELC